RGELGPGALVRGIAREVSHLVRVRDQVVQLFTVPEIAHILPGSGANHPDRDAPALLSIVLAENDVALSSLAFQYRDERAAVDLLRGSDPRQLAERGQEIDVAHRRVAAARRHLAGPRDDQRDPD